ncbi:MAG: ABC transporter permease [Anaerolineae bacterium]
MMTLLRRGTVFIFLLGLAIFFSLSSDRFLQERNITNILIQNAHIILVTVGMTFTMLSGGIDLSVGSVAALCGAVSAGLLVRNGLPAEVSILIGLALGFLLGTINGLLVVVGKLPPFIATLAMLGVARGLTLFYTDGRPVSGLTANYTFWGRGSIGDIPTPLVVWVVVVIVCTLVLTRTRFGLHVYAVGGNPETARLAGVRVDRVKVLCYAISGMLAALAGVLLTGRVNSAQPQAAVGLELEAITAAVLGGVSLFGGVGNIPSSVVGALLVGVLGNGMNLMRVQSYPQQIIQGIVLVAAVALDMFTKRLEGARTLIKARGSTA